MGDAAPTPDPLALAAFAACGEDPGQFICRPKPGPPTPWRNYEGPGRMLTYATNQVGRDRCLVEVAARRWAETNGIHVPELLAFAKDGSWFLARLTRNQPPRGPRYVSGALDACDRISELAAPDLPVPASRWEGERRTLLARVIRLTAGGLPLRRFRRAKALAEALEDHCTCHGDFYRRNVLLDETGGVQVVDWEFLGTAPRYTDHLRLWSTLRDPSDRRAAWERITAELDAAGRRHVATLSEWLVLRLLAENLSAPSPERDPADMEHARILLAELPQYVNPLVA